MAIPADREARCIPSPLREGLITIGGTLDELERELERIDPPVVAAGRADASYRRLITAPGYGANSVECHGGAGDRSRRLPAQRRFCRLTRSGAASGRHRGKVRRDPISKLGNGYLCRLLVSGATALIKTQHRRQDRGSPSRRLVNPRKGGDGGSGQQAGTHRLGVEDEPGGLRLPTAGGLSR